MLQSETIKAPAYQNTGIRLAIAYESKPDTMYVIGYLFTYLETDAAEQHIGKELEKFLNSKTQIPNDVDFFDAFYQHLLTQGGFWEGDNGHPHLEDIVIEIT